MCITSVGRRLFIGILSQFQNSRTENYGFRQKSLYAEPFLKRVMPSELSEKELKYLAEVEALAMKHLAETKALIAKYFTESRIRGC